MLTRLHILNSLRKFTSSLIKINEGTIIILSYIEHALSCASCYQLLVKTVLYWYAIHISQSCMSECLLYVSRLLDQIFCGMYCIQCIFAFFMHHRAIRFPILHYTLINVH